MPAALARSQPELQPDATPEVTPAARVAAPVARRDDRPSGRAVAPPSGPPQDAAALQALAARELVSAETPADPRDRRGPLRPGQLVSSRSRSSGAMAVSLFRAGDFLALGVLATVVAATLSPLPLLSTPLRTLLPFIAAAAVGAQLLEGFELYRFGRNEKLSLHLAKVALAMIVSGAVALGVAAFLAAGPGVATALVIWSALGLMCVHMLHVGWWAVVRDWRTSGKLTPNVVVVGATKHAERLIKAAIARRDVNVIGVFDDRMARSPTNVAGVPVLGGTLDLLEHRITPSVDRVVIAVDPSAKNRVREIIDRLKVLPNEVSLLVDLETELDRNAALKRLGDAPLTRVSGLPADDRRALSKRAQDLLIGTAALVILSPVIALTALAVRLDSPGPVFFRQRRHGFNNETITVWKFRSMRVESTDYAASRQVTADDDRITRVGKFIRKTSLDELPQLLNVLKGEMSLVGPRPHAVGMKTGQAESSRLVAEYAWRHRMKPGMTGWAAIKGSRGPLHNPADVRRRVSLDIEYIERQSFWLDLYVMAMTIPCLLGDREAIR